MRVIDALADVVGAELTTDAFEERRKNREEPVPDQLKPVVCGFECVTTQIPHALFIEGTEVLIGAGGEGMIVEWALLNPTFRVV
jgi:hypothetical protein